MNAAGVSQGAPGDSRANVGQTSQANAKEDKEKTSLSLQSQLTSSLLETSEDEEAKKKEAEKNNKKQKKGLTDKEIEAPIDIELSETETIDMLYIPGIVVAMDTPEHTQVTNDNKKYEELKTNKIGSDSYNERGSQTLNLTQKQKEIHFKGFVLDVKQEQASNWDIDDA